ncbi:sigma factor-like helix-turn-helix DNA-binding protein [Knoellia sp. S7-12]|uniref:sigma factor-like helix-turn-helix DNA-binding protein n=1 Tax=Knoellia sp. S7-12 TaxID=3126698 RepID=UPI00338F5281
MPDERTHDDWQGQTDRIALHESLTRLPHLQRAVLVLRYLDGQSEMETARILGCTLATVQSKNRIALKTLRLTYHAENASDSIGRMPS